MTKQLKRRKAIPKYSIATRCEVKKRETKELEQLRCTVGCLVEFVDLVLSDQNKRITELEKNLKGLVKKKRRGGK